MDGDALLTRSLGKSSKAVGCVSVGTRTPTSIAGVIALYFFVVLGLLGLYAGLIRGPARDRRPLRTVREESARIARSYGAAKSRA